MNDFTKNLFDIKCNWRSVLTECENRTFVFACNLLDKFYKNMFGHIVSCASLNNGLACISHFDISGNNIALRRPSLENGWCEPIPRHSFWLDGVDHFGRC